MKLTTNKEVDALIKDDQKRTCTTLKTINHVHIDKDTTTMVRDMEILDEKRNANVINLINSNYKDIAKGDASIRVTVSVEVKRVKPIPEGADVVDMGDLKLVHMAAICTKCAHKPQGLNYMSKTCFKGQRAHMWRQYCSTFNPQ